MEKRPGITQLKLAEELKIIDWIRSNKQKLDGKVRLYEACEMIGKELGISCSVPQLQRVREESGVSWISPKRLPTLHGENGAQARHRKQITVLTDSVLQLYCEYGATPSAELQILKKYLDAENAAVKNAAQTVESRKRPG